MSSLLAGGPAGRKREAESIEQRENEMHHPRPVTDAKFPYMSP